MVEFNVSTVVYNGRRLVHHPGNNSDLTNGSILHGLQYDTSYMGGDEAGTKSNVPSVFPLTPHKTNNHIGGAANAPARAGCRLLPNSRSIIVHMPMSHLHIIDHTIL